MTPALRTLAIATAAGTIIALSLSGMARAITDTVFKYSSEKTGWYTINPAAFAPATSTTANTYSASSFGLTASAGGCFNSGVNLPHGAKPTALAMWYSSDTSPGVTAELQFTVLSTGAVGTNGTATSTDTTNTRQAKSIDLTGVSAVNNQQRAYLLRVCINGTNDVFLGGRITYTYTNAGD